MAAMAVMNNDGSESIDTSVIKAFLAKLSPAEKAVFIMLVMFELTLTVRALFYESETPCDQRLKAMYRISEMNHRLTPAAWQALRGEETYSDDALLELMLDQSDLPELEPSCRAAVEYAMKHSKV